MKPTVVVCWILIVATCIFVPSMRARSARRALSEAPASDIDMPALLMGRYIVGAAHLFPTQTKSLMEGFEKQPRLGETQQIAAAVVIGEVKGREAAVDRLRQIDSPVAKDFLRSYDADAGHNDLSNYRERFGWFADLAQSFAKPDSDALRARVLTDAHRTFYAAIAAIVVVSTAGVIGLGLFVTAIVLISIGKIRVMTTRPLGSPATYIEAFTIYMVGIIGVGLLIGLVFPRAPLWTHIGAMFGLVLLGLLWPSVRRVAWADQRRDWGIHTGRGILLEALCGIGGYLAGLPIMAAGIGVTSLLLAKSGATATHPIVQDLDMNPLFLLGIASIFAPLTEELMFRGAFVSHLRAGVGVVLSAVLSGVVFASIHPQGWAAIPALGSIGVVLALVRQWRGSLIASMTAHALNNTFVLTVLIVMTR